MISLCERGAADQLRPTDLINETRYNESMSLDKEGLDAFEDDEFKEEKE